MLQTILDHSPAVIYLLDLHNRHLLVNRSYAELLSTTPKNLLGKSIYEVWSTELADVFAANNRQVLDTGRLIQTEEVIPHADGQHFYLTVKFPLIDTSGTPYAICGISTGITEKKQLEEQFYRTQRLESLGILASGIAHDLNNILTPMLAVAQLLPRKVPNLDERTQQLLVTLENSAKQGAEMVKQILLFGRGNGAKHVSLQIAPLLNEVVQVAKSTFPKDIDITVEQPERDLWLITADKTQLNQVFLNLLVNARDAMPDGGSIKISAQNLVLDEHYARMNLEAHPGPYVIVEVADTGTGIPLEIRKRIFDPFFTTKDIGQGTGLGLATVLGIIKSHGGFVQVTSEVGQGSQFQVYLPAAQELTQESMPEEPLPTGNGELILVVDDEAAVREITKYTLEDYNYRVLLASDGIEAIAIYAKHQDKIKVVVIDLVMPNLNGVTAIRTLQKMNPQVKIVAMSGSVSQRESVLAAGAKRFLAKPYTAETLLRSLLNL